MQALITSQVLKAFEVPGHYIGVSLPVMVCACKCFSAPCPPPHPCGKYMITMLGSAG